MYGLTVIVWVLATSSWLQAADTARFHLLSERPEKCICTHGKRVGLRCEQLQQNSLMVFDPLYTSMDMDSQKVCGPCPLEAATAQHNPSANG